MKNPVFTFENLTVYQRSLKLSQTIYQMTGAWPREHLFGITDQLRRAVMSIPLNIAEGYSRTRKDFKHFLTLSRGSCFECIPLIKLAGSLRLISQQDTDLLYNEFQEVAYMLSGLRSSLKE